MELSKRLPNIQLICKGLQDFNSQDINIYEIIDKFPLNEDILTLALPIICQKSDCHVDEKLKILLSFYASADKNENLRLIALNSISTLDWKLLKNVPQCVFSLLLDDNEEIRNEMCKILGRSDPLNPSETLKRFIKETGELEFIHFLDFFKAINRSGCLLQNSSSTRNSLFEKEPLNLFIDPNYLVKKFLNIK